MRDATRSVVAAALPVAIVGLLWSRMEEPVAAGGVVGMCGLALVPALLRPRRMRLAAAALAFLGGLSAVFAVTPTAVLPWTAGTWFDVVGADVADGLRGFERLALPFDPAERPTMHALVLVAVLVFGLLVSLAVAERRALLAGAVVVVGGGWATASVGQTGTRAIAVGSLLLVAVLWPLVVLRFRSGRDGLASAVALGAVVALGAGAAGAGAAPDEPYLDWKDWSVVPSSSDRLGVRYVWEGRYEGIRFPSKRTTVLRIRADRNALYWRASTLDLFSSDRWLENLYPIDISEPSRPLPPDSLLPAAARDESTWVEQEVEVVRLDDERLIGAGQPVRLESSALSRVLFLSGGVMQAPDGIDSGERYTVWSYVPRPLPRDLLASKPRYPDAVSRYLGLDRAIVPAFGVPGRERVVDGLFTDDRYYAIRAYRGVWDAAQQVAAGAPTPYEATLAVERWLRSAGGFRYEEQPQVGSRWPLADFVLRHRAGYCQHFAGAMALMLRMLGIPARVAVGFTSGRWKDGVWDVADRDAHAWVEVWFDGLGWVTFDPTPGRGTLTAGYTFASDSADAIRALGRGALLDVVDVRGGTTSPTTSTVVPGAGDASSGRAGTVALGLLALTVLLVVLAGAKVVLRRFRYASRDPRRIALAVRRELEDVLRDQRVPLARDLDLAQLRDVTERSIGVPVGALVDAIGRARFGPPATAAQAAADARHELRRVLALTRERLSPSRRLRGALSFRSLVVR